MIRIFKISTYGLKNIEKTISLDFDNMTISRKSKNKQSIKAIYGYNGSGKTAYVSSIKLYKDIITNLNYLLYIDNILKLEKKINFKLNEFFFEIIFSFNNLKNIYKHSLLISKSDTSNKEAVGFHIEKEELFILKGNSINGEYENIFLINNGIIKINKIYNKLLILEQLFSKDELIFNPLANALTKYFILHKDDKNTLNLTLDENNLYQITSYKSVIKYINVFTQNSDLTTYLSSLKSDFELLIRNKDEYLMKTNDNLNYLLTLKRIKKEDYSSYLKLNLLLTNFIKVFKPSLKTILIDKKEEGSFYHLKQIFDYGDYKVDLEYESSGIKKLVDIYPFLKSAYDGNYVFIDEIDTNINEPYLNKLIEFLIKNKKGYLLFTCHNLELMRILKKETKSIVFFGDDNSVETRVKNGNSNPSNEYKEGLIINSPINIEDFDFLTSFINGE